MEEEPDGMCFSNDRAIMLTIIMTLKTVDCYWPLSLDAEFFRRYPGIPSLHMITGLSLGRFDELLGPSLWVRGNVKWKNVFSLWGFDNAGEMSDRIVVMGKSNGFGGMRLRWVNFYSAAEPRAIHPKQMLCGGDGVRWEPPNTYHALQRLAGVGDYFSVLPLVPQGLLVLRFLQRATLEIVTARAQLDQAQDDGAPDEGASPVGGVLPAGTRPVLPSLLSSGGGGGGGGGDGGGGGLFNVGALNNITTGERRMTPEEKGQLKKLLRNQQVKQVVELDPHCAYLYVRKGNVGGRAEKYLARTARLERARALQWVYNRMSAGQGDPGLFASLMRKDPEASRVAAVKVGICPKVAHLNVADTIAVKAATGLSWSAMKQFTKALKAAGMPNVFASQKAMFHFLDRDDVKYSRELIMNLSKGAKTVEAVTARSCWAALRLCRTLWWLHSQKKATPRL